MRTPIQIFTLPQQLVIPLFQRPYVWSERDQWEPLWHDVRRLAELRLADPASLATHFLGAIVVQAQEGPVGDLPASNIIDGQQRLTTLQILMDATAAVLEESGNDVLAGQLESLTDNQSNFLVPGTSALKLRHTNRDRVAFDEVMDAEPPVIHADLQHAGSLIAQAHGFYARVVEAWLDADGSDARPTRAATLVRTLTNGLQLVAINLSANENSQEIFETLNARGTPLTAADLIKNFVFQQLAAEGADTKRAYHDHWPFDTKFWEKDVSVGRYLVSRSSLFLNQWLVSRLGEEISPQSTFTRFKSYVALDSGSTMGAILLEIQRDAELYEAWTIAAVDPTRLLSPVEMAFYRMQANDMELLKPLILWVHRADKKLSHAVIEGVIAQAESWYMRRALVRLTGADLGRVVADLIRVYGATPADDLVERVGQHLSRLNVSSTYWPNDSEVRESLATESAYKRFRRGRLRSILEAVENSYRDETNAPQVPRIGYPIEHLMPQKWQDAWPVDTLEEELDRAAHLHRLGNLTLLTSSLNSKVSNGSWQLKQTALAEHDTLLLNSRLQKRNDYGNWDESAIDTRTSDLVDVLLAVWPTPDGHIGEVVDAQDKAHSWVEIKELVVAGLLTPGTALLAREGSWGAVTAVVTESGLLDIEGTLHETPSGAGRAVRGGATNGWTFWRLEDGRRLLDVRTAYRAESSGAGSTAE